MSDLLKNLNAEQKEAVTHGDGPLLIVAGAGTGKTTVITSRIAHLIMAKKCRAEEVLALTFTDKAAGEMEERVDRLLPYGYVDLWISTFHAFCERLLKEHGLEIGLPNNFKLLNTTQQWLLVRQNLDKFNLDYYRPLGNPTKFIHALVRHFSRAKDENISPAEYLKYAAELRMNSDSAEFVRTAVDKETIKQLSQAELKEVLAQEIRKQEEVANAYHVYQQLLLANNSLDFGDLINYALKLFNERKNILARYRGQFKYLLVDEFQDTNWAQYELLKLLASPKNNLTVVGDDDQSIYKFRGASIANILQFKDDFQGAQEIYLVKNYRSRQNILDLSYKFIQQNNPYRLEVKLANEKFGKKLSAQAAGKGTIGHLHGRELADEVKLVIEKIIELYNASPEPHWSDFAILVRANSSAEPFSYAFTQANVPYQFMASKGLYNKKVVLDILAYLKLLDDYHEGAAAYRVLTLPIWGLGHRDIVNLNYWAIRKGWSLFEAIKQVVAFQNISGEAKEKISGLLGLVEKHSQLVRDNKNTTEVAQAFLNETGYLKAITADDSVKNREALNHLNQFYKRIQEFEKENDDKSVKNFLTLVELELAAGEEGALSQNWEEEGPDSVKVMTVHAAKGLEFKHVFIVNLVDKRFPAVERSEPIELPLKLVKEIVPEGDVHLMEERRLFYVAMTRAKEGLFFTSADDYGGARQKKLSRFLSELSGQGGLALSAQAAKGKETSDFGDGIRVEPEDDFEISDYLPSRFSFTQLKAFESCPYQYRFAHVLKVPAKGKPQFSYGQSVHLTLQRFFQLAKMKAEQRQANLFGDGDNPGEVSFDELLGIYASSFIDDWFPSRAIKEQYYKNGAVALRGFFENYQKQKPKAEHLEYSFNFKIGGDESYTLGGKVDRIDRIKGGLKIIDYKTGQPKSELTLDDKEQLLIYQLAMAELLDEPVKELAFYYFDSNREVSFLGQEKDLAKTEEKAIRIIEEIKKGSFPPKPGRLCDYCDFSGICDFRA